MRLILILAGAMALAGPVLAGQPVMLKADTVDADGIVTLGDLFDGAGSAASVPLASRQGASLILDAGAVQLAARRAGLDWANLEGVRKIVVRGSTAAAAHGNVDVLTYARSITAGEVVQPADLVWSKAAAAPSDTPSDPDLVIGQAAKRPLRAGAVVLARDVGVAQIVKPGEIVTVTYDNDGITLSLQGKAMTAGGVGETIGVQNASSKKIIQAVVTGPGEAMVGPGAALAKTTRSARYAAR